MEIRLISKDKGSMELELPNENETLLEPLKQRLLEDDKVEYATYIMGHPLLDKPRLIIRVTDGKPQAAIKRAAKSLSKEFSDMKSAFKVATGGK